MTDAASLDDILPLVGEDSGNRSLWIGLGGIAVAGLLLFAILESNRQVAATPQIAPPRDFATASAQRAQLAIPITTEDALYAQTNQPIAIGSQPSLLPAQSSQKLPPVRLTTINPRTDRTIVQLPPNRAENLPEQLGRIIAPDTGRSAPAIVYDGGQAAFSETGAAGQLKSIASKAVATGGGDRTYLVSQGTLIFAVLETAIDSTQSGQVRAMISKHVYNALGTQILIPKGSRIFGEYKGELGAGQNRAQIIWTRLIRPDGATIALDSPASDQLGRAGVKGEVNTHFGERLLGALLQSTIDFGVLAASRAVTNGSGVVVALPGNGQASGSQIIQSPPKPTLKVKHGTGISVFVSRDLDFSAVK